jgi:DNA-binding response OmpR family regulator
MRGSVLIIDDDQAISEIVASVLSDEGFLISELRDAQPAAIQAEVARLEPDVVLLDGGDGRTTATRGSMRPGCANGLGRSL